MAISPDDLFLALCKWSGDIRIFDLRSGQLHADLKCTVLWGVRLVSFRSDGRQIAFADRRGRAEVWDLGSSTCVWKFQSPEQKRESFVRVAFSPQKDLVACSEGSHCSLVDAISGERVVRWDSSLHSRSEQ